MFRARFLAPLVLVPIALGAACSAKQPNPPVTPTPTTDAGAPSDASVALPTSDAGVASADAGAPVATGPVFFTDAGAAPPQTNTNPNTPMTAEATDAAIDAAILAAATKNAPKMEKEGQPGRATLVQGEHFGMLVTMAPNRCYTIIGFSPSGAVTQLDLKLLAPPLYNIDAGKSAPADKGQPVIGKGAGAMCPILPIPIAYKIDAAATKGAGRIGIQVFSRAK